MRKMFINAWLLTSLTMMMYGCSALTDESTDDSQLQRFFENARRRDATDTEAKFVVRIPHCTAFFIENNSNQAIVASARHCFAFDPLKFCKNGGSFTAHDGQIGHCTDILAGDDQHDIVMFRADFSVVPAKEQTLRVSSFSPELRTPLKMIGYPEDPERRGSLTVTDNCYILQQVADSPFKNRGLLDESARHNCSTFGGNSGGPMIIEGTRIVAGLPLSFNPYDFTRYPADEVITSAFLARMDGFVARNRQILMDAGVVFAERD